VTDDPSEMASAWWDFVRLSASDHRADRLNAEAEAAIVSDVNEVLARADSGSIALIDAMLRAPGADPDRVGVGPLEDLLGQYGQAVAERVAVLARQEPLWRAALGSCNLEPAEAARVPSLAVYLPNTPGAR
jgi:hypothetical protein